MNTHVLLSVQFSRSVVSDFATPRTAARQASLSFTNSRSLLKHMSMYSKSYFSKVWVLFIQTLLLLGRKVMTNLDSILKNRDIILPTKVLLVKAIVFPVVHVWMWELNCEESWALKNWCFWTVVLEKSLESPLDCKEIQPVHPKWDQS